MPDHIHTIPVLDALREPQGCAFCVMLDKLERDAIQFITGPAYMEDDIRMETNKTGFCKKHLEAIYKEQNRLGLGLMLHTHVQRLVKDLTDITEKRIPATLFAKDRGGVLNKLKSHLQNVDNDCYVCKRVESTFLRYIDTFFYLWGRAGDEARLISSQKGYCLPHFIALLAAVENLSGTRREKFLDEILPAQMARFKEMENDLEWFTLKFDHRNADEPWKSSKDALPRAIGLMGGYL
ncbi:MAG: DUF6062 family protein [Defluviitaleaceae bacterium]|nr:DUF6062 family protein [Defluviitaleaceae bacterium]